MGADYIDYMIADKTVVPESHRQHYSEKIIYLPNSYQSNDFKRAISEKVFCREEMGLKDNSFVFCCFNNSFKILPRLSIAGPEYSNGLTGVYFGFWKPAQRMQKI